MVFNSEQSFCSFQHCIMQFFTNYVRLAEDPDPHMDPDPHWEKQLDPDAQKLNADPQPWQFLTRSNLCWMNIEHTWSRLTLPEISWPFLTCCLCFTFTQPILTSSDLFCMSYFRLVKMSRKKGIGSQEIASLPLAEYPMVMAMMMLLLMT